MSLTNPNDVVTEQRLSEFYGEIYPYLGGLPELVCNKFSRADLYSTDEKMIGRWIDGKPLYQKTFTGVASSTDDTWYTIGVTTDLLPNVDTIVSVSITGKSTEGYAAGVYYNYAVSCGTQTNSLQVQQRFSSTNKSFTYNLTVQYTKTTDATVEIGNDTDYSTTEKIIGTWIDGKPVYQRTFQTTTPSTNTVTKVVDVDLTHCIVVNLFGHVDGRIPINATFGSSTDMIVTFINDDRLGIYQMTGNLKNKSTVITIQYTKTTD